MKKYKSIIFDCDGVVLNSNKIKTESFRLILRKFNKNAVEEFVNYHKNNGGISRYIKLDYFLTTILPKYSKSPENKEDTLLSLLKNYSHNCKESLYQSEVAHNLEKLKAITYEIPWIIVSGGDQKELRDVFEYKKISKYFNGGIFGSPEKKFNIIKRESKIGFVDYPALSLGDSKLDHTVAKSLNIDFLFVTNWTDFKGYKTYCEKNRIDTISSISELIDKFKFF
tara:strand:+ start:576 stop:1250 length:675 start_codon:yes stop_codon:yes gene_type:complete